MNYSYDKKPFPISRFFIKIMLIIVIVFLSIWLYSKYKVNKEIDTNELTKEQVFSNNLEKVKNAALKYYDLDTVNKLTSNNDKVTLKVLIDKKYIKKLKDYDNKSCNINKTYALLTKIDDYYKMKVNLNCQGVKDYISLTLKPNLNCKTYLCDASKEIKKDEEVEEVEVNDNLNSQNQDNDKNSSSNIDNKNIYKKSNSNEKTYKYEYAKTASINYSNWSNWSNPVEVSCQNSSKVCNNNSICLKEIAIEKQQIPTIKTYNFNQISIKKTTTKNVYVCKDKSYILYNNVLYETKTDYDNLDNWSYRGRFIYDIPPKDTLNDKYIYVGIDYSNCGSTCSGRERYYFDKYSYSNFSSSSSCSNKVSKNINVYSYTTNLITAKRNEYLNKCYQKVRTRTFINRNIDYVWSNYKDTYLLNRGYQYTGKKQLVK